MRRADGLCESLDRRARRDAALLQQFTEAALEMFTTVAEHEKRVVACRGSALIRMRLGHCRTGSGTGFVGIDAGSDFEQQGVRLFVGYLAGPCCLVATAAVLEH